MDKLILINIFEINVDPDQLASDKSSDEDPYYFPLWLKMHAYYWNAAG